MNYDSIKSHEIGGHDERFLQVRGVGITFATKRGPFVALRDIDAP